MAITIDIDATLEAKAEVAAKALFGKELKEHLFDVVKDITIHHDVNVRRTVIYEQLKAEELTIAAPIAAVVNPYKKEVKEKSNG